MPVRKFEIEDGFAEVPDVIIRSSASSILESNSEKLKNKDEFIDEYTKVCQVLVDILWNMLRVPSLLPAEITGPIAQTTWLSARCLQACGKQASGIVRGTREKARRLEWSAKQFELENNLKMARKMRKKAEKLKVSKPELKSVCPELDSRFVRVDVNPDTSEFDLWVTVSQLGRGMKLVLPVKKTRHFNKLMDAGALRTGIRLSRKSVVFMFVLEPKAPPESGASIGIDIGQNVAYSCSDGTQSSQDIHGHDLVSISSKIARKQRGSKGFERACRHRSNHIGWCINRLGLENKVSFVSIENIRNMKKGRRLPRRLTAWTSSELLSAVESECVELGVQVRRVSPTYTSQRCPECGWVQKSNRKGISFRCRCCGFAAHADLVGSRNIGLPLPGLTRRQRQKGANRRGFFWLLDGQQPIVAAAPKPGEIGRRQPQSSI